MVSPTPGLSRYSMILVGNSNAEYFYDPTTERLCVTLPYERPKGEYSEVGEGEMLNSVPKFTKKNAPGTGSVIC